jgi:hypothetical protein
VIQTASPGASVPRARQSYLFDHLGASAYPPISRKSHLDASDDRSIPPGAAIVPPEIDPEEWLDPEDPDSLESDPQTWPAWTDSHRYAVTRGGAA